MSKKLINEDIQNINTFLGINREELFQNKILIILPMTIWMLKMDEERRPEILVKHIDTGKLVGTHKYGRGFRPNPHGEELGFEHHPSSIPNKTKFGGTEVGDFDYEDDDFDFKMSPYDDEEN
jgi:hypothetical protein